MSDEYVEPVSVEEEKPKMSRTTIIIIVVVAVILLGCACACLLTLVAPTILGPSIGNIFSDIATELVP